MATLGLVPSQPRALAYSPGGVRSDLRLLQVDESLLKEISEQGVVIKGGEDDEAVLCTSSRTYAMKLVETTNLQLLVRPAPQGEDGDAGPASQGAGRGAAAAVIAPPMGMGQGLMTQWDHFRTADSQPPVLVSATSDSHIELVEVAPRLGPLRELLWRRPYGMEDEASDPADGSGGASTSGLTFEDLLAAVQASPAELRAALAAEGALELYGRWRAVDPSYLGSLLEIILLTAEQEGLSLGRLREGPLAASLAADGYHPAVVRHCLSVYGKSTEGGGGGGSDAMQEGAAAVWALDPAKVCIHFAHKVMGGRSGSSGGSGMPLQEFTDAWARAVPHGMTPSLDMLRGEALVDGTGAEARISPFRAAQLPGDPAARFAALFRRRARWEWTHLEPYLAGIRVPGQSVEALLMRFARASQPTPDDPLVYSAR